MVIQPGSETHITSNTLPVLTPVNAAPTLLRLGLKFETPLSLSAGLFPQPLLPSLGVLQDTQGLCWPLGGVRMWTGPAAIDLDYFWCAACVSISNGCPHPAQTASCLNCLCVSWANLFLGWGNPYSSVKLHCEASGA